MLNEDRINVKVNRQSVHWAVLMLDFIVQTLYIKLLHILLLLRRFKKKSYCCLCCIPSVFHSERAVNSLSLIDLCKL